MKESLKEYCEAKTKDILRSAELLDASRRFNKWEIMNTEYCKLLKTCTEMTNVIKSNACMEGCDSGIDGAFSDTIVVDVSKMAEDIVKISFAGHPSLRVRGYTLHERNTVYRQYIVPLTERCREIGSFNFCEKVTVAIIHTYVEGETLIDHDNYEVKPILDAIASLFFVDDTPARMSLHIDYAIGEQSKTDIYIVPARKFVDFLRSEV